MYPASLKAINDFRIDTGSLISVGFPPLLITGSGDMWKLGKDDNTLEGYPKEIQAKIEDVADILEILEDEQLMGKIRQSMREIENGKTIPAEQIMAKYGL